MEQYQQRVVEGKVELDKKVGKLVEFVTSSPVFATLPRPERGRLVRQLHFM